jgi:hypothetical protein
MKTYICISMALILATLPMSGQSVNGASVQTRQVTIAIPVQFGVAEFPDWLPADIQQQIQILIESQPDALMGWATFIVIVVIVVVTAVILYCLWRCSQMIPPSPPPIPDDPSLADLPHALVYNLNPALECELQFCTDLRSPSWVTMSIFKVSNEVLYVTVPKSDTMFFRLETK